MNETNPSPALRKAMQQAASEATKRGLFSTTSLAPDVVSRLRVLGRQG